MDELRMAAGRRRRGRTPPAPAGPRWLIDRRVAALLFVAITIGLPLRAAHTLGDALDEPTLRAWLVTIDAVLKGLVGALFAVLIYRRKSSLRPARSPLAFVACAGAIVPPIFLAPLPGADAAIAAIVAGETLVIVAVLFTLVSVLCLGTCFGVLPEVRGLVTRGPYRFVRHPVYLGEIVALAGFVLASQHLLNLVALAAFCVAQIARLRMEEAVLSAEFPAEYGAFASRTPRLIPRPRRRARCPTPQPPPDSGAVAQLA